MEQKKKDRRVLYTKMFLRESLLTLMKEKSIAKITPTELCRHAGLNRNTFYTHYNSPEALLENIENEFYEQVRQSIEKSPDDGDITSSLAGICRIIFDNRDLCSVLFTEYGNKHFLRRIIDLAHDRTMAEWDALGVKKERDQMELLYCFSVNGSISVIQKWIQDGMRCTPQEISHFIEKASAHGLSGFIS